MVMPHEAAIILLLRGRLAGILATSLKKMSPSFSHGSKLLPKPLATGNKMVTLPSDCYGNAYSARNPAARIPTGGLAISTDPNYQSKH